jgi:hypothetical protein
LTNWRPLSGTASFPVALFDVLCPNGGEYHTQMKLTAPGPSFDDIGLQVLDAVEAILDGRRDLRADAKGHP